MHVWDALSSESKIDFSAGENGRKNTSAIAYMTENPNLTRALLARLESLEPISSFENAKVTSIDLGPPQDSPGTLNLSSYPHVTTSSSTSPLVARLLIGADGINSPVRTFAHIPTRGWDYDRHGVVATVRLASRGGSHSQIEEAPKVQDNVTAYQRFLPSGPIALLALPGDYASLVWSTTPEQAARLKGLDPADFAAMVNAAFRLSVVDVDYMSKMPSGQVDELAWRLQATDVPREDETKYPRIIESVQEGSVASFPLRMRQADQYVGERVALVGDAAHTIHPLAGQGLNMGLADVASLVRAIEYSVSHGGDIGVQGNLEAYESEMWMKNNRMLGVVDKLHKLYGVSWWPVVGLRSLGLGTVDKFNGLKGWMMSQAGG
ncbi:MAG: Putative ubiquinone biosynthesis monooxygenase [Heterodermia speciosa]|uniref:Ubiquinone biosynthesis monooxygenase n=1 Tax=Heterodermia speciosa TaxID=116794 RepID=A0A8H3G025_9LECA|nr:MAG: Putative ubiquinone biosynthesis monooxygenase [Heterodermia speciosa]